MTLENLVDDLGNIPDDCEGMGSSYATFTIAGAVALHIQRLDARIEELLERIQQMEATIDVSSKAKIPAILDRIHQLEQRPTPGALVAAGSTSINTRPAVGLSVSDVIELTRALRKEA